MKRKIIHTIAKFSDWPSSDIQLTLENEVYASKSKWNSFIRYLLLATGIIFLVVGIIFFFAFNWDDIPKMVKLGIPQVLIVMVSLLAAFGKFNDSVKEILLIGDILLVGSLFAVFGQIYQTGANAYDFFLGWTMFATLWVLAGNSLVLWTIFLTLANTTLILYFNQVKTILDSDEIILVLFLANGLVLLTRILFLKSKFIHKKGKWFQYLLTLFVFGCLVVGILFEIFDNRTLLGLLGVLISFPLLYQYAYREKDIFYLGVLGFSTLVVIVSFIVNQIRHNSFWAFLLISMLVIVSIGLLVQYLMKLNQKWYGNK